MVERFDAEYDEDIGIIYRQSPKGSHVRYSDYAALEAENARLVTEEMVNRAWARASEMSRGTIMANKSALREVLKAALTGSDVEWEAIIYAQFETVGDGLTGTTSAPIKRIERQDDGSLTVVIDHWPTHTARAPKVSEDLVEKKVISILEDIEPWALDDTGLHIPDTEIEKAAEKIMCILTAAGFRIVGTDEGREADLRDFVEGIEDPVLRRFAEDKLSRELQGDTNDRT